MRPQGEGGEGASCPPNNFLTIFPNRTNPLSLFLGLYPPTPSSKYFVYVQNFYKTVYHFQTNSLFGQICRYMGDEAA